ncbi:unnamed protein product [Musa banksii]
MWHPAREGDDGSGSSRENDDGSLGACGISNPTAMWLIMIISLTV